ncbi:unnamed protein product [Clavelina lepadiformis]|uniref:RNA helicase n=1 Tax=Clavelina lepadiformis TaxID=159417 RepID=A0ABP0GYR2_CLALP
MTDLIGTIKDDDDVMVDTDNSDVEEEVTLVNAKQRERKKMESKGFNASFSFTEEGVSELQWSLDFALESIIKKKKVHSTLTKKIEEVRRKRLSQSKVVLQYSSSVRDNKTSEMCLLDETSDSEDEISNIGNVKADKFKPLKKKTKKEENSQNSNLDDNAFPLPLAEVKDSVYGEKSHSWDPTLGFQQMNLSRPLLKSISKINYTTPTPIQQAAIPIGLLGRDICACAATGTGKTAAFMLPVLERLLYRPSATPVSRVLCLVPTRELAVQVYSVTQQLAQHSSIRICLAAGGLDIKSQEAALRQSPDIIIATPGRLIDHLHNTPSFDLRLIEILILDEADRMLDEFFEDQMNEIIKLCSHQHQTLLFSATMTEQVQELVTVSLKDPVKIFVNSNTDVAPYLRQEFIRIRENREADREAVVAALCSRSFVSNVLVFTQTKKQAHRMHIVFGLLGIKAGELHGNLSQGQRLESLKQFKTGEIDVLVCTDLAARGLDIENVKTVCIKRLSVNSIQDE